MAMETAAAPRLPFVGTGAGAGLVRLLLRLTRGAARRWSASRAAFCASASCWPYAARARERLTAATVLAACAVPAASAALRREGLTAVRSKWTWAGAGGVEGGS